VPDLQKTIFLLQGKIKLITKYKEALSAELVKQRQLIKGYIKQAAFFKVENFKLQV
jgi:hypothetical protein